MKLIRFNGQKSAWAALLLSGFLLAGCGQEDDAEGTAVPDEDTNQEQSAQDQQDAAVDEEDAPAQDDQFVSEEESDSDDEQMNGESSDSATAPEEEPLSGDANEEPGSATVLTPCRGMVKMLAT